MSKLWRKDYDLDSLIEEFTVSNDYLLDARLVPADCLASLAHATMLESIGILSPAELAALKGALIGIIQEHGQGRFLISRSDEDCHTAIENALTKRAGEAGKKIHTGRSRNDQVLAALRLYARSALLEIARETTELSRSLADFAERTSMVPMAGRTHMQLAMPSSVGLWAGSFAEELLDDLSLVWASYLLNDQSPLQNNVLYANHSRGKIEAAILDGLDQIGLSLSKLAEDLMLFSMPEFGYFSLPAELCSGSSIMPQKRNPDALELMRARSATLSACSVQVKGIIRSLPSGYNRDFQETKEPFFKGLDIALSCLRIMKLTVEKLEVHEERLRAAFTAELFATDAAIELVGKGMSFRDAYREVGLHLDRLAKRDPADAIGLRTSAGTSGNLGIPGLRAKTREWSERADAERERVDGALNGLAGLPVAVA
jgi:argininosuccinate lyase